MFNPTKAAQVVALPVPATGPVSEILLRNGARITGRLVWFPSSGMGKLVEVSGREWVVDVGSVVALSPTPPVAALSFDTPPPLVLENA